MLLFRSEQWWNPFSKHSNMHYGFTVKISICLTYYWRTELINSEEEKEEVNSEINQNMTMYHPFLLKGFTILANQLPVIFLQMHCAYHTWDLSPFPSLFPGLPDGKIPPLFCLSIGGRDGAAWWGCSDLHSAPYSEEPRTDWTSVVLLHWRKAAPFLFTFLVTIKQKRSQNPCEKENHFLIIGRSNPHLILNYPSTFLVSQNVT